jgi:lipopolysaccharide transport system permease protein
VSDGGAASKLAAGEGPVRVQPSRAPLGPAIRVEPSRGWQVLEPKDLWRSRELLYYLTWRDIKVRYKQTVLGGAWAVLQPFLTMVVFSLFFGHLAQIPSEGVPYPLFAFAALVPWTYFSNSLTLSANSLIGTPDLVTKVYFPRVIMPAASVFGGLLDLALSFVVLLGLTFYYGIVPGVEVLVLPLLVGLEIVTALAVALWLSALNVEYRDVRYAVPFLAQLWLFVTPVAYPSSLVGEPWRAVLALNPMTGVVEGFRWALLGTSPAPGVEVLVSAGAALVLFVGGLFYFRRVEDEFPDVI